MIKFRVWDKKHKQMSTIVNFIDFERNVVNIEDGSILEYDAPEAEAILEQYTGLKDSNGVEVYEGDIVKVANRRNNYVDFQDYGFGLHNDNFLQALVYDTVSGNPKFWDKVVVIGNIHENSELLEQE